VSVHLCVVGCVETIPFHLGGTGKPFLRICSGPRFGPLPATPRNLSQLGFFPPLLHPNRLVASLSLCTPLGHPLPSTTLDGRLPQLESCLPLSGIMDVHLELFFSRDFPLVRPPPQQLNAIPCFTQHSVEAILGTLQLELSRIPWGLFCMRLFGVRFLYRGLHCPDLFNHRECFTLFYPGRWWKFPVPCGLF